MKWIYITFRSVTYAQKAQRLLDREGIRGTLLRTPRWMEPRGCSYAIRLGLRERERVTALLGENGIPWEKCFGWDGGGQVRAL